MFFKKFFQKKVRETKKMWYRFTKKSNKHAADYIPSLYRQTLLYQFMDKEAKKKIIDHVWPEDFRIWLIGQGDYSLVDDACTSREAEVILNSIDDADIVVRVLNRVTPTKEVSENFLKGNIDARKSKIIREGWKAFVYSHAGYHAWLLPTSDAHNAITLEVINKALAEGQQRWVKTLLEWAFEKKDRINANMAHKLVIIARENKLSLPTTAVDILQKCCPVTYAMMRENILAFEGWGALMITALKSVDIDTLKGKSLKDTSDNACCWLAQAIKGVPTNETLREQVMKMIPAINKVNSQIANELSEEICKSVKGVVEVDRAMKYLPASWHGPMIWHTNSWELVKSCFPFVGWRDDYKKAAIQTMVSRRELFSWHLSQLDGALRKHAIEELESTALVDIINKGSVADLAKVASKRFTHERCEIAFLKMLRTGVGGERRGITSDERLKIRSIGDAYLKNFEVSTNGFKEIMLFNEAEGMVRAYAENHGLTQAQYELLLSHKYLNRLAPLLKKD